MGGHRIGKKPHIGLKSTPDSDLSPHDYLGPAWSHGHGFAKLSWASHVLGVGVSLLDPHLHVSSAEQQKGIMAILCS